jgi:hypothetical protein
LDLKKAKVFVTNVDSQSSMSGGVIVQVLGELSNNGDSCQKFCQTFFLAEQPEGYYVLNDMFRFLKEDIDADYDEVEENGVDRAPTFTYQDSSIQTPVPAVQKRSASPVKQETKPAVKVVSKPEEKKAPAPVTPLKEVKQTVSHAPKSAPVQQSKPVQPTKPTPVAHAVEAVEPAPAVAAPAPVPTPAAATAQPTKQNTRPASPKKETKPQAPVAWAKIAAANSDSKPSTPPPQTKPVAPPVQQAPAVKTHNAQPSVSHSPVQSQPSKPVKKEEEESDGFKEITRRQPERRQPTPDGMFF